ncbi:MAG: ATP-binding cassette domain-containing protein [Spartobacteria bacterium]|nr:ATP-binding cassette domain-containing protein [Spartobacteria bacterium]
MALVSCQNLSIRLGGPLLLDDVTLQIERGERIGLLGRNGEGKSTLLKVIGGEMKADAGDIILSAGVHMASLHQQVDAGVAGSTGDIIRAGLSAHDADADHHVERLCSLMDLDPEKPFDELSGGQKRRAMLGRALVGDPDVLLLDEPTNHLDMASIEWLESFLIRYQGSLFFVTHDRAFLQRLATRIVELDRGHLTSWTCDYTTFLGRKDDLLKAEEQQWKQFDKKLAQEEVWIRQGIKARRTRNEGRVRALEGLRQERAARRERTGQAGISIQKAERSGRKVITAKKMSFGYADLPDTISELTTTIMRGDRIGIIGPNGCGKTTLLNLLLGRLPPREGTLEHGTRLEIAYFDQHRHQLEDDKDVKYNVADGNDFITLHGSRRHVISYLQDFLFSPERIVQPVSSLSGGERNRLLLARLFTKPSNVLVLDEPTNDLDVDTLELLEAQLMEYEGTVLLVSHDRVFLDNLCSSCFVFEDDTINEYVGGYSDWQQTLKRRRKEEAASVAQTSSKKKSRGPMTKKLSNREREELEAMPQRLEELEEELEQIQLKMGDPAFFRGDPHAVRTSTARSAELPALIEQTYARWNELEQRA